jgi:hypothetical protein
MLVGQACKRKKRRAYSCGADQRIPTERYEIEHEPEEERAELRAIYRDKGLSGPLLDRVVRHLTSDGERWHRAMVHDELGVVADTRINPWLEGFYLVLDIAAIYAEAYRYRRCNEYKKRNILFSSIMR